MWNKNLYRQEQEAFVSNHEGSTSREVIYAIMPNICSILLTTTTLGLLRKHLHRNIRVLLEFILLVVPCVLCCTVLSDHIVSVCLAMMSISIVNIALLGFNVDTPSNYDAHPVCGQRPFITNFRALINIMTAVCILAIDFPIFPRRFAKTEVFGYSLMDTGVGLFVLANALVASEAKDFSALPKVGFVSTLLRNFKHSSKKCVPLLILGIGRSVVIELLGYQKHVTEYGVHWNFFITLAFVKLFTSSITTTIDSRYSLLSGIWILGMHEYILSTKGLKEWVLSNEPRIDFISANREGVVSIPGYVGLYLIGVAVGRLIHSTYQNLHGQSSLQYRHNNFQVEFFGQKLLASYNDSMILCIKLSLIAVQTCAATLFCDSYFRVSRLLANAGYCMWILTLGVMMLTLLLLVEIITDILLGTVVDGKRVTGKRSNGARKENLKNREKHGDHKDEKYVSKWTIEIFESVNYNGQFFFLLSNIMTGCINMLIFTLYEKQLRAVQILIAYMAFNLTWVLILYRLKVKIRL